MKGHNSFSGARGHGEQYAVFALKNMLDNSVNSDVLIIPGDGIGKRVIGLEKAGCVLDAVGSREPLP